MAHTTVKSQLLCALTLLVACSDPPAPDTNTNTPPLPPSPAMISSSTTPGATSFSTEPGAAVAGGEAYVSMMPETMANGLRADIRNLRTGATASTPMVNGGFDPVPVAADVGDTLSVAVIDQSGGQTIGYGVVPVRLQLMVVRTSPAGGKTDVPLNSVVRVVFNQPMDGVSLPEALHLRRDGLDVPGTISGESTDGVILSGQFVPTVPLAPSSVYQIFVSTEARSLDGQALAAPVLMQFTTQSLADTGTLAGGGSIQVNVHTTGAPLDPDGYTIIFDNGSDVRAVAPVNGQVLLDLTPGDHRVRLEGAADNCWLRESKGGVDGVPSGAPPLPPVVRVTSGDTVSVTFDLVCLEPGTGTIDVHVERSGDPFSYFTTIILTRSDGLTHTVQPGVLRGLPPGSYQVWLTGGTPFHIQCAVTAPNPRTVELRSDSVVTTAFDLFCVNE